MGELLCLPEHFKLDPVEVAVDPKYGRLTSLGGMKDVF
jgi:hypothetical protein